MVQRRIRAALLILNGADDPYVKPGAVEEMGKALDHVHVDWSMATYGHAQHGFSNRDADKHHVPGVAYDARADRRSWASMRAFLAEHLK